MSYMVLNSVIIVKISHNYLAYFEWFLITFIYFSVCLPVLPMITYAVAYATSFKIKF